MNKRNILTISSIAACAVLGGTAAWLMQGPGTSSERIQVTTVGQGPTTPGNSPGTKPRPGGPGPKQSGFGGQGTKPGFGGQTPGAPVRPGGGAPAPGKPGKPGGVFSNGKGAASATPAKAPAKPIPNRKGYDPFYVTWRIIPPPPYVFGDLEPIRLAPPETAPIEVHPYEVREEAVARVSGIMSGSGIYAILEMPQGDPVIVKPGSTVELPVAGGQTKRTYKVVSIKGETVVLSSTEGLATYTQEIPLSDVPLGGQSGGQPGFGGRGPGSYGGPGGGPPGSGRGGVPPPPVRAGGSGGVK